MSDDLIEAWRTMKHKDDEIDRLNARIIKLENQEVTNARLVEDIAIHKALITDLEGELTEIHEQYKLVMEERCAPDEHHCTCVPFLRKRIAELEATVEQMKCCQNCIHMDDDFPCEYEHGVPRDNKCDKWEAK